MFFYGLFLSLVSFFTILSLSALLGAVPSRFLRLLLPLFPLLGLIFLLIALFAAYLYIIILFCSAALSCFYAASRLKKRCRCSFSVRPHTRKK